MNGLKNLLVELLVEELPPKALRNLGDSFAELLLEGLKAHGLATEKSVATAYASPRRLAAHISAVRAQADDVQMRQKLMPVAVAYDANGALTAAARKKLASLGVDPSDASNLQRAVEGKAEFLFLNTRLRGAALESGLQAALDAALVKLPIPKLMTYQLADGWTSVNFARPAHGLVALHGADVVGVTALGLQAGRQTRGHRFEAKVDPIVLPDADHYAQLLHSQGAVIASFADRRSEIARQLELAATELGLRPIADDALLDEVTALVEHPRVLACQFEREFLQVPQECLILTMKANQKYFPVLDTQQRLTHRFLIVSNIDPEDPAAVIQGNERVVRARLADAKFFFDRDRKQSLSARTPALARIVYHSKLGTQGERVERVRQIARAIGERLGGAALAEQADRAAFLSKADLLTDMVGEFPELQGVMGGYYARHDGENEAVALAIEDHYKPRFAGDALPRNDVGVVLALADKLETLAGLFGIGQMPSGDKDPFALRRQALGVIRMLDERDLPLPIHELVSEAYSAFPPSLGQNHTALLTFIFERMAGALREQGYSASEVDAVLSMRPVELHRVRRQLDAVRVFAAMPEAPALASASKRVGNILKKAGGHVPAEVDDNLLCEGAEQALAAALRSIVPQADAAFKAGDYPASLQALAALKASVDAFFDGVLVNTDDTRLRANRLALLARLHSAMTRVANLSRLAD